MQRNYQDRNWGAVTGRHSSLYVVDFNHRSGGLVSQSEFPEQFPAAVDTVSVETGADRHDWFAFPGGSHSCRQAVTVPADERLA